ncbi:MAG TPA: ABC transporter permease [Bryobacteraceae bacterium]|nr:ABC transporter permease [Bryobacteraceae bacterium]
MTRLRTFNAYLSEARYETLRMLRTPAFAAPFLVIPGALYLLFAVVIFGPQLRDDPVSSLKMFAGLTVLGMMGPGMFGFGTTVAIEREQGLLKLKQALPMPSGAYLLSKMIMTLVFCTIIMGTMIVAALFAGHLKLSASAMVLFAIANILGSLPFCALGLLLGAWVSGASAPGFVNLIYLPMMWLSGLFFPMPKYVQAFAPIWPSYHLLQISFGILGLPSLGGVVSHFSVLVVVSIVLFVLAVRRLAR